MNWIVMDERRSSTQYSLRGLTAFVAQGPFEDELLFHQEHFAFGWQIFAWVDTFSHGQFVFWASEIVSPDDQSAAVTHKFLAFCLNKLERGWTASTHSVRHTPPSFRWDICTLKGERVFTQQWDRVKTIIKWVFFLLFYRIIETKWELLRWASNFFSWSTSLWRWRGVRHAAGGTDCVGIKRPCECEQHDLLGNTKRRAHRGELFSKHICIRMKTWPSLEIFISKCQQLQHMNRLNQFYVTFTLSQKLKREEGSKRSHLLTLEQSPQNGYVNVLVLLRADVKHRDLFAKKRDSTY